MEGIINITQQRSLSDLEQIKEANRQNRILLALDKDFKTNSTLFGSIREGCGVILIESADPRSAKVIQILNRVLKEISIRKLRGKICCASIDKISYR